MKQFLPFFWGKRVDVFGGEAMEIWGFIECASRGSRRWDGRVDSSWVAGTIGFGFAQLPYSCLIKYLGNPETTLDSKG